MSNILSDSGVIKVTWRHLTEDDLHNVADMLWQQKRNELPVGYFNTTPRSAWFSVTASAIQYNGLAIGAEMNGGAVCAVVVATADSRGLVMRAAIGIDDATRDALLKVAKDLAAQRGMTLGRLVEVNRIDFEPVA